MTIDDSRMTNEAQESKDQRPTDCATWPLANPIRTSDFILLPLLDRSSASWASLVVDDPEGR